MMFKVLVLQKLYKLSNDETEYQINDRMRFIRFLGFGLDSRVPEAKNHLAVSGNNDESESDG